MARHKKKDCLGFAIITGNPVDGFGVYLDAEGKPFVCESDAIETAEGEGFDESWWIIEVQKARPAPRFAIM